MYKVKTEGGKRGKKPRKSGGKGRRKKEPRTKKGGRAERKKEEGSENNKKKKQPDEPGSQPNRDRRKKGTARILVLMIIVSWVYFWEVPRALLCGFLGSRDPRELKKKKKGGGGKQTKNLGARRHEREKIATHTRGSCPTRGQGVDKQQPVKSKQDKQKKRFRKIGRPTTAEECSR